MFFKVCGGWHIGFPANEIQKQSEMVAKKNDFSFSLKTLVTWSEFVSFLSDNLLSNLCYMFIFMWFFKTIFITDVDGCFFRRSGSTQTEINFQKNVELTLLHFLCVNTNFFSQQANQAILKKPWFFFISWF